MFVLTFLFFVVLCSTSHAGYPHDAFETICVPDQACYYVSKFKATWETAREMCEEKIQQDSVPFNETDNMVLDPLADNLLTKRYWVLEPTNQLENHRSITIILNRKRRSVTLHHPKAVVTTIAKKHRGTDSERIAKEIEHIIKLITENRINEIDLPILDQLKVICGLCHKFEPDVPDKVKKERLIETFKFILDLNWPDIINKIPNIDKVKWTERITKLVTLIKNNEIDKIDLKWLQKFQTIIRILHKISHRKPLTPEVIVKKVNRIIDIFKKWNWPELVKKVDEKDRENVTKEITNVIKLITENRVKEIDLPVLERIRTVFRILHKVKPEEPEKDRKERLIEKFKFIVDLNIPEILNKLPNIDKVKWTEEITKLVTLIKNNEVDKIDLKWLEKFRKVIKVIEKVTHPKPLTPEVIVKKVDRYVNIFKKWNWPELVKKIDEKDREKVTKEITDVIKLVTENRVKEIDLPLLERIRTVFKILYKVKPEEPEKDKKQRLLETFKFVVDINWPEIINQIPDIDKVKWTEEITKLVQIIKNNEVDKIDLAWLEKFQNIIRTLHELSHRKPEDPKVIVEKVTRYVDLFKKWNWPELVKKVDEKDRERVTKEITDVIKLINENRVKEIDLPLLERIKSVFYILQKVQPEKPTDEVDEAVVKTSIKFREFLDKLKWPELVDFIEKDKRPEVVKKITEFITLVDKKEFDKIDTNLLKWLTEIIVTLTKIKEVPVIKKLEDKDNITLITEKSIRYVELLEELKWEELVKYIDPQNRPNVVTKIKSFIDLVKNKKFKEIDINLINWVSTIITSLENIRKINVINKVTEEKNIKVITDKSTDFVKDLKELKWEELVKFIDENKREETIKNIKTFITLVEKKEFDKIDTPLLTYITDIITKLTKTKEVPVIDKLGDDKNKTIIIETSTKTVETLKELKWEELVQFIDEANRPEVVKKINTFITFVNNKEFDKIDAFLFNSITNIITTFREVQKINVKVKEAEEKVRKTITDNSVKYIKFLEELKWEELVKYIDEDKRPEVITKIKQFVTLVQNKELDKIDSGLFNWITDIITTLKTIKVVPDINKVPDEKNKTLVIDTSTKYTKILVDLNWEELLKSIDVKDRPAIESKIKTFITYVDKKEFDKIDTNLINQITPIITELRKIREVNIINQENEDKNRKRIIELSVQYIEIFNELKWEELVKYIDEKSRPEVVDKVKKFTELVNTKQFEKIDNNLINWIHQIVIVLRKIREVNEVNRVTEENNKQIIMTTSVKYFNILNELKWEELTKYIAGTNKDLVINKIKTFVTLVQNKQFDKIDIDLINFITEIITTLRRVKEINDVNQANEKKNIKIITDLSVKYIEFLNELKWEELVKNIDPSQRPDVVDKIKTFITYVNNKQFDKIDTYMLNWMTEIITTLKKIREINVINKVTDENNKQIIKTTSVNYFNILNELKWEELVKYIDESQRPEITKRIKDFLINVEKNQFDKIDVNLLNWLAEVITVFRKIQVTTVTTKKTEILNKVQITLPGNWQELLKRIPGVDHNLWIGRITYLLSMTDSNEYKKVDIDWVDELQRIIQLISQEYLIYKKEHFLNEGSISKLRDNVKSLKEWKWETLLVYIDEKNRAQVQKDITEMISVVASGKFETLDVQFVNWFNQVFGIFTQITDAIKDGYEFDAATKTWVKHTRTVQRGGRRQKRSADSDDEQIASAKFNVRIINESISKLQKALFHNMMILKHEGQRIEGYGQGDQSRMCPFINKVDNKLTTKLTNCEMKQRFICKRKMN